MLKTLGARIVRASTRPCAQQAGARARAGLVFQTSRPMSGAPIDASKITIERTTTPGTMLPKEDLAFGATFSDHMLEIDWTKEDGWGAPVIRPFQDFKISPAASVFHYALECFEGMKAYLDEDNNIRLFRPDMNMKRMNTSVDILDMPQFDGEEVIECIKKLVVVDKSWIPKGNGYSLYLRPTVISTHPYIGVAPANSVKLFVIMSPVGPYYKTGFAPVKLLADPANVRAWPGGTGNCKVGGNYAMGIRPGQNAVKQGYAQILWLFGDDLQVTEVGTMNQFFLWINKEGNKELITAKLDGTILPGVTRDSILQLCRAKGEFLVTERRYTLPEVIDAVNEGRMIEAFGAGTAAIVSPVEGFSYDGTEYAIPLDPSNPDAGVGPLTKEMAETLMDIQYGRKAHEWSVKVEE